MGHLFFILLFWGPVPLHGDVHQQIDTLTHAIQSHPDSLELYVKRGELYLLDEDLALAKKDFLHCIQHGLYSARAYTGLSKSFSTETELDSALHYINLALEKETDCFPALEWKANVLFLMKEPCSAAIVYDKLLQRSTTPSPSLFIDAANARNECPGNGSYRGALAILKEGLSRIGELHVLEKELVRLSLEHTDYDTALFWQTKLIQHTPSPARALVDRAEIYFLAEREREAKADLQLALTVIDQLPAYRSATPSMTALREKIQLSLHPNQE